MENVLRGEAPSSRIRPTMVEESIPPLRKAPRGTSLMRRSFTASFSRA
jgi:hypothetical protein